MSGMFQDVAVMNTAYGNPQGNPLNLNWDRLNSQALNIKDEYDELMNDGIHAKNLKEVRDAICDILVFTLGLAHMAGVPVESDMAVVYASNMSKFCRNQQELEATMAKYQALGLEVYTEGEFPMARVKSAKDQVGNDGKSYPGNKMLKGVGFQEPVFYPL